jgi:hypothetical protein
MLKIPQVLTRIAIVSTLVGTCALQSGAAEPNQDDFAKLDRSYVPALALTKMGTRSASEKALQRLDRDWQAFRERFDSAMPDDNQWPSDCQRISQAIATAKEQLDTGHQLEAHEALEAIREILMESRVRSGLDYYLDHMTRFHDTMEEIVLTVKDKKPDELSQKAVARLPDLARKATQEWNVVKSASFDAERFGFSKQKLAQRQQLLKAETLALQELEQAIATGDLVQIIKKGQAIKPPFAKSFMLFGDIPPGAISLSPKSR